MRPFDPPPPNPTFRYRHPPRSGNTINGLGESERRRPSKVFHRPPLGPPDREPNDWAALDFHFNMIQGMGAPLFALATMRHVVANRWQLRRANGPIAKQRVEIENLSAMADNLKTWVVERFPGALVGIAPITKFDVYEGVEIPGRHAVCIGLPMDRGEMKYAPQPRANKEVMRTYRAVARAAVETSEHIRSLGWPAKAFGDTKSTDLLHIPLAVRAGLGQLGKHGSLISREYGSNFRLATVATDLPLVADAPVDIGVDDLCLTCRRCTLDCPPDAIFDEKRAVRGERRWYVDFDKCVPYFAETGGCSICIEVCPWSEPGRGADLSAKLLAKRDSRDKRIDSPKKAEI